MTIVVGYAPSTQGRAARAPASATPSARARRRSSPPISTPRPAAGGAAATEEEVRAELEEQGADLEGVTIRRGPDREIGEFLLATIEDVQAELVVIEAAPQVADRQAEPRRLGPQGRARRALPCAHRQGPGPRLSRGRRHPGRAGTRRRSRAV
ncbi:hypothetical protein [Brachybacterium sp. GPGPB12]|uniref:hypothetical protein n=1 Tax=Brachybacterium sp. GPGPB12 TaxID=3023517 RepID=UPI0031344DAC